MATEAVNACGRLADIRLGINREPLGVCFQPNRIDPDKLPT